MAKRTTLIFALLTAAMLSACSSAESSSLSDTATTSVTTTASSVAKTADLAAEKTGCKVYFDNTYLHDGVVFDDMEFNAKISEYIDNVISKYEPSDAENSTGDPKGGYLKIDNAGEHSLFIGYAPNENPCIDGKYYTTEKGETTEFMNYVVGFFTEQGYYG